MKLQNGGTWNEDILAVAVWLESKCESRSLDGDGPSKDSCETEETTGEPQGSTNRKLRGAGSTTADSHQPTWPEAEKYPGEFVSAAEGSVD